MSIRILKSFSTWYSLLLTLCWTRSSGGVRSSKSSSVHSRLKKKWKLNSTIWRLIKNLKLRDRRPLPWKRRRTLWRRIRWRPLGFNQVSLRWNEGRRRMSRQWRRAIPQWRGVWVRTGAAFRREISKKA